MTLPSSHSSLQEKAKVVEVAIGIILRHLDSQPEVLLAERSQGQHYAGYWEFPGGKVERGEHPDATLKRELQEELAIEATQVYPWGGPHEFAYPHAHVRLFFYRVTEWKGSLEHSQGAEGQTLRWFKWSDLPEESLLPANRPLLHFFRAPTLQLITDVERYGEQTTLKQLEVWLDQPIAFFVQVRDKTWPEKKRLQWGQQLLSHIKQRRTDCPVLWNGTPAQAAQEGFDGMQCPQSIWQSPHFEWPARLPDYFWKSASCHTHEQLNTVKNLGFHSATYSPVHSTSTHSEVAPLGWETFAATARAIAFPIFALGGLSKDDTFTAWQHGAHGIALCSAAWTSFK